MINGAGMLTHVEYVKEVAEHPDYETTVRTLKAKIESLEATLAIKDQVIQDMRAHQSQLREALIDWNIQAGRMKPRDQWSRNR